MLFSTVLIVNDKEKSHIQGLVILSLHGSIHFLKKKKRGGGKGKEKKDKESGKTECNSINNARSL